LTDKLKALITQLAAALDFPEPITEFGSLQVEGQEGFADLRPLFPGKLYTGVDMRPGPGVDVVLDVTATGFRDGLCGSILCLEMLEHCDDARLAVQEMHRMLHPSGFAVISVPFSHPIHAHPNDYYRWTQEGLRLLLKDFAHVETGQSEPGVAPGTVAAVAWKSRPTLDDYAAAREILKAWPGLHVRRRRTLKSRVRDLFPVGILNMIRARYGEHPI
jgi:SAM-dependent methyltransferase